MSVTFLIERHPSGHVVAERRWFDLDAMEWRIIPPRRDLENHSEDFDFGYEGSSPAQLALALLADALDDDARALLHHQGFKHAVVARWAAPPAPCKIEITRLGIVRVVEKIERYGWRKVTQQFSRDRDYADNFIGLSAFRTRK